MWKKIALDLSFRKIAADLNISVGTALNIYKLFVQTNSVDPKDRSQRREVTHRLDSEEEFFAISLVLANSSLMLSEVCHEVSVATICHILKHYGLSRKKLQKIPLQRSAVFRGMCMAEVSMYRRDMFIWVDESGCSAKDYF